MNIEIYPPVGGTSPPFASAWYGLEILQVQFSLDHKIHEYKIKDNNVFMMEGFEHSTSSMSLNGVLSDDSVFVGSTLEDKKDNLILAASEWWTKSDQRIRTNCARIKWRNWEQYMMIERLNIEKTAGEESYDYELSVIIHEGK